MTYSPLTNEVMPPTGLYKGGVKWQSRPVGVKINGLNVHHHATTGTGGITRLVSSSDPASANYIIRTNGSLIGSVQEQYRAWTTSAYANDDDKITVEIQNSTGAPDWKVSDAAFDTLVRLYADLAKRYGFATSKANIYGHRDYAATACPGPHLYPRLGEVAAKATALNATPITTEETFMAKLTEAEQRAVYNRVNQIKIQQNRIEGIVSRIEAAANRIEQSADARRPLELAHFEKTAEREIDLLAKVDGLAVALSAVDEETA
jgi:hypothetical protein